MRQQQIVKKVNSVLQDSIGVFVDNSEGLCDINENLIQKGDYFNTSNGYIYGYDGEATIVKINDVFKKISLGYTSGCKVFSSNSIICYKLHIKENVVDYLLLNDDKETNFHIAGRNIPVYREGNKIIFTDKKKQIFLYDVRSNDIIWSYTCPEGRKIEGNLYAYQEVLAFIEGDEEGETTLVGLDIHSGEILYKEVVGLIHYQQQGNKLYGFASTTFGDNTYSEIDILKGEVYEKSFPNYKRDTVSHLATIKENYLYYSIYKDGGIGIIDTKKKEIIKEEFLDIEDGVQIEAPVVTEDKIYILDSEQVLHIYQREM